MAARVPETYLLNFSQLFHMVMLAAFVPWLIGLEAYGTYAALVALPALFQSAFEAFCVTVLARFGSRDLLKLPVLRVMLPISAAGAAAFFALFDPLTALLGSITSVLLFTRSYAFAIAISTGVLTRKIMQSEGLIVLAYVVVLVVCVALDIKNFQVPMLMVIAASALSAWYLLHAARGLLHAPESSPDLANASLPLGLVVRATTARAFEDGLLTLSPLLLALMVSPTIAGQFRIFVSAVKLAYKCFPLRYEIVVRDVLGGRLGFAPLARVSGVFVVIGIVLAVAGYIAPLGGEYKWLLLLTASAGAVVAALALYPVSCAIGYTLPLTFLASCAMTFTATIFLGLEGFVAGFALTSYAMMIGALFIIKRAIVRSALPVTATITDNG
jgi:hypothetical protein